MYILSVFALHLAFGLSVNGEAPACPDQQTKDLLQQYKVNGDITPLLKGNTYVDIWRRVQTTKYLDCSMTKFTEDGDGLNARIHDVEHQGTSPIVFDMKWKEYKGESSFYGHGDLEDDDGDMIHFDEHIHIFYADENVFGYFSCDVVDSTVKLAISVRTDKEKDAGTSESIRKAEGVMENLKVLMNGEQMTHFTREKCPKEV